MVELEILVFCLKLPNTLEQQHFLTRIIPALSHAISTWIDNTVMQLRSDNSGVMKKICNPNQNYDVLQ
jgi:hypothetical protein